MSPQIGSDSWVADYSLSSRVVCRKAQLELARRDDRVFSLEADLAMPTVPFQVEAPRRLLQFGIAESNLVGVAVGLSASGKIPFVNSFSAFLSMRACAALRMAVAIQANVKFVGFGSGISGGPLANTHYSLEDLAILRSLGPIVVICPADSVETYKATCAAWEYLGPVYIRLPRAATPQIYRSDYEFEIGRAIQLRDGRDATIVATGTRVVYEALKAADRASTNGVRCKVVNMHTIQPLDDEALLEAARATGAIVTVEEHNVIGGLGTSVAEVIGARCPVPVVRVGLRDTFCDIVGPYEEMAPVYGVDVEGILEALRRSLILKKRVRTTRASISERAMRALESGMVNPES